MQSRETIWILGGGKFGLRAAKLLRRLTPQPAIVVIDNRPGPELTKGLEGIETICADAVDWFTKNFVAGAYVSRVVPAIPQHVAVEWLKAKLAETNFLVKNLALQDELLNQLPNPFRTGPGQIAVSYADFLCPENCPEPEQTCTVTGEPRSTPLYSYLKQFKLAGFTPVILRSRQFAPGVGGFYPEDLWHLLAEVEALPQQPLLIGTACKCHGIVDGLLILLK
ncbi:hypothetical protein [Desulforhopalus sp. IMCC35007]|uniref:hypothetical protein n=1 Tax=Desulforhopalus sp. IMCC35007 TaxID=2569543 RepID=UPI0010AE2884|nr:hypothetical protein [Desulforhopalus sp. IMCC35007]TKB06164.1 hypothetical protein FCL48_22130 [Desulforhopalus sp. IMCC35007]